MSNMCRKGDMNTYKYVPSSMSKCGKHCDLCSNYLVFDDNFVCTATGKKYKIRCQLSCNSINVTYLLVPLAMTNMLVPQLSLRDVSEFIRVILL